MRELDLLKILKSLADDCDKHLAGQAAGPVDGSAAFGAALRYRAKEAVARWYSDMETEALDQDPARFPP